jgi:hypothetical protein
MIAVVLMFGRLPKDLGGKARTRKQVVRNAAGLLVSGAQSLHSRSVNHATVCFGIKITFGTQSA